MIDGIINVYKERGYTSHDVVAKLRGILKQKRIGHTGTLDPEAEGVLPVCLGKATKVCGLIMDREKTYRAVLLLGTTTDTQDTTGQVLETKPVACTEDEVRACIRGFVGEQEQIPPMYSALKVDGKKLYELARQGLEVERKPRKIEIREILVDAVAFPEITLTVTCSKGTYIRTLCHDIGAALGCGGCMKALLRTKTGPFLLEDSVRLAEVEQCRDEGRLNEVIRRTDSVFLNLPALILTEEAERLVRNGNALPQELVRKCTVLRGGTFAEAAERPGPGADDRKCTVLRDGTFAEAAERPGPGADDRKCTVLRGGTFAEAAERPGPGADDGRTLSEQESAGRKETGKAADSLLTGQVRVYGGDRRFLALYEWNAQKRCLCAKTMFL